MSSFDQALGNLVENVPKVEQLLVEVTDLDKQVEDYRTDPDKTIVAQRVIYKAGGPDKSCLSYTQHLATMKAFRRRLDQILISRDALFALINPRMLLPGTFTLPQKKEFNKNTKIIQEIFEVIVAEYNRINNNLVVLLSQDVEE